MKFLPQVGECAPIAGEREPQDGVDHVAPREIGPGVAEPLDLFNRNPESGQQFQDACRGAAGAVSLVASG